MCPPHLTKHKRSSSAGSSILSSTFHQNLSIPINVPVTSLSISPNGREGVLAAKRGLYIIDMELPHNPPKVLSHLTKWDVSDVQWHPQKEDRIASTSNQKVLIWNVASKGSRNHVEFILQGHKRAVSDVHWSPFYSDVLATCSYDTYIHLWDMRISTEKPCNSFCAWTAGATQVKWNRLNEWIIASSHDTDARIWDIRKGSSTMTLITAHMKKVYGIDWSRIHERELITCSQDGLVKFWDYTQPRTCQATIDTGSPVWRARFTPFGNHIVTMPQRKDTNLYLWDCEKLNEPVITFSGHTDVPTEFVWRVGQEGEGERFQKKLTRYTVTEYQLVTWSKDQHLRLWPMDSHDLTGLNYKGENFDINLPKLNDEGQSSTSRDSVSSRLRLTGDSEIMQKFRELDEPLSRIDERIDLLAVHGSPIEDEWEPNMSPMEMSTVEREIRSVESKFPGVSFQKLDGLHYWYALKPKLMIRRSVAIGHAQRYLGSQSDASPTIIFEVYFQERYPYLETSRFDFSRSNLDNATIQSLTSNLYRIIAESISKSVSSLEACIRFLVTGRGSLPRPKSFNLDTDRLVMEKLDQMLENAEPTRSAGLTAMDVDLDSDSSSNELNSISLLGTKIATNNMAREERSGNVPYPRLCQGTFSGGKLVYFFSVLPHPYAAKFTTYTLSNRHQQPVLQSQNFTAQPKTYALYESYRAFLLSRVPKMMSPGMVKTKSFQPEFAGYHEKRDGKIDYWLDDEDEDDDEAAAPSLYWRPKPNVPVEQATVNMGDFLKRLHQASQAQSPFSSPASAHSQTLERIKEEPTKTPLTTRRASVSRFSSERPYAPKESHLRTSPVLSQVSSPDRMHPMYQSLANIQEAIEQEKYPQRRTRSTSMIYELSREGLSPQNALASQPRSTMDSPTGGMIKTVAYPMEKPVPFEVGAPTSAENTIYHYGANVYYRSMADLDSVSEQLAHLLWLHSNQSLRLKEHDLGQLCHLNRAAAEQTGRPELIQIWSILELFFSGPKCDPSSSRRKTRRKRDMEDAPLHSSTVGSRAHPLTNAIFQRIFAYLEKQRDVQTLAIISFILSFPSKETVPTGSKAVSSFQIRTRTQVDTRLEVDSQYQPESTTNIQSSVQLVSPKELPSPSDIKQTSTKETLPRASSMGALKSSYSSQAQAAALGLGAMAIRAVGMANVLGVQQTPYVSYAAAVKNSNEEIDKTSRDGSAMSIVVQMYDIVDLEKPQSASARGSLQNNYGHSFLEDHMEACIMYRYQYAEFLYRWGLYDQRIEMLKGAQTPGIPLESNESSVGTKTLPSVPRHQIESVSIVKHRDQLHVPSADFHVKDSLLFVQNADTEAM